MASRRLTTVLDGIVAAQNGRLEVGPMSALGQKQTYASQQAMSALHPIVTEKADMGQWSCPLCLRKRTCAVQEAMSAKGQKRTFQRRGTASNLIWRNVEKHPREIMPMSRGGLIM